MKAVKLTITSLLILVAMTISGDLFQDYLRHFEFFFDSTSFHLPFRVNGTEMTQDILQAASKHHIRFFTVQRTANGVMQEDVFIYYSHASVLDDIREKCEVEPKSYRSVLLGNTNVFAEPFENSADEFLSGTYYLLGEYDNLYNFKMDLMDIYGGGLIRDGYKPRDDGVFVAFIWVSALVVFFLLSLFEYNMKLKGHAILLSMGANPGRLALKNIIPDFFVLLISYSVLRLVLSNMTNPSFYQAWQMIAIAFMLGLDFLLYLRLYFVKAHGILKGNKQQNGLLIGCYAAKYLTTVLTMLLVATNLIVMLEAISYRDQGEFWQEYNAYHQLSARYVPESGDAFSGEEITPEINYKAYSTFFHQANITLMSYIAGRDFLGRDIIAYNQNAVEYLKTNFPGIHFDTLPENRVVALLPARYFEGNLDETDYATLQHLVNYFMDWDGSFKDGAEVLYYDQKVKLLSVGSDNEFESRYYEDPIVVFVNIDETLFPRINTGDTNIGSNTYFTMYHMQPEEFKRFFEKYCPENYNVQLFSVSIGEQYQYHWDVLNKSLYINSLLTILFLILNLLITVVTVRLEYSVNAVQLALQKVMGYTFFERQRKLFFGCGICSAASTTIVVMTSHIFHLSGWLYVLCAGILFFVLDLLVLTIIVQKAEKERIIKILKGGAL